MARTLVFEGCPTCERGLSGFGQPPLAIGMSQTELLKTFAQGGAVGGGSAILLDIVLPMIPFVKDLPATVKPIVTGGIPLAAAIFLYKKNPSLAMGIGVGGVSIAAYKLIGSLLGKAGFSGFGEMGVLATETAGYGALAMETAGYGQALEMLGEGESEEEFEGYGQEVVLND